jgi:thiol-disulfide isomerase/thioredoxin
MQRVHHYTLAVLYAPWCPFCQAMVELCTLNQVDP